jgi:hypothetical protein
MGVHARPKKGDAQHNCARDAPEDHLGPKLRRDARGRQSDHDRVVAGQYDVDDDDLCQSDQLWVKGFHPIPDICWLAAEAAGCASLVAT